MTRCCILQLAAALAAITAVAHPFVHVMLRVLGIPCP